MLGNQIAYLNMQLFATNTINCPFYVELASYVPFYTRVCGRKAETCTTTRLSLVTTATKS